MSEINLSAFDGAFVRITCDDADVFEGVCTYDSDEYCEIEFGNTEDALEIDNWIFYRSRIRAVEPIEEKKTCLWMSKPAHRMPLSPQAFRLVETGEKTVEPIPWGTACLTLQIGDVIRFENTADDTDVLYVEVKSIDVFPSFADLFAAVPYDACGCTSKDIKRLLSVESETRCGAAAIRFESPV